MPFVLALHDVLKELLHGADHILVIGLGNRNITPDALGPSVVDHLYITRHLLRRALWNIPWKSLHYVRGYGADRNRDKHDHPIPVQGDQSRCSNPVSMRLRQERQNG